MNPKMDESGLLAHGLLSSRAGRALKVLFCALLPISAEALPIERCINLSNALEAPAEGDWGPVTTRADIRAIADAGFDTIRLPVRFSRDLPGPISEDLFLRIDEILGWAEADGLKVILDLHHFRALMDDPGGNADAFVSLWSQIGARYASKGDWLVFELLNEPEGNLTTARADALFDRVIPVIRERHPDRWIITGGGDWNSAAELQNLKPRDARTAHTFHIYGPFEFTHQGAPWLDNPPPEGTAPEWFPTERILETGDHPVPVLLGEFGVIKRAPEEHRLEWIRQVREAAEEAGIGWCLWGYEGPFGIRDGNDWQPGTLEALGLSPD